MTDFYEDDEPVAELLAAFERGEKGKTVAPVGWRCEHVRMSFGGLSMARVNWCWCGCTMTPIFPDQLTST